MSQAAAPASWWELETIDAAPLRPLLAPALERLRGALDRGRFPQSLLLVGPQGLGREAVAVATACMLACPDGGDDCACSVCRRVRRGLHPDVVLVRPQGAGRQIRIDQVRQVVSDAPGRPFEASRRVWIFDGVEASSFGAEAANAFLKTLEEPPAHVVFLLLAGNPEAVLSTILSRCQRLPLPGPVAVAGVAGAAGTPPELLTAAATGAAVADATAAAREALSAATAGEPRGLLLLAHRLHDEDAAFQVVAAAALELAAADAGGDAASGLVRLAAAALAAERRSRSLNLSRERQLLACLLDWYRS